MIRLETRATNRVAGYGRTQLANNSRLANRREFALSQCPSTIIPITGAPARRFRSPSRTRQTGKTVCCTRKLRITVMKYIKHNHNIASMHSRKMKNLVFVVAALGQGQDGGGRFRLARYHANKNLKSIQPRNV